MRRAFLLLLVATGIAVYANSLDGPLVFDDLPAVRDNVSIRRLWPLSIPLTPPERGEAVSGRPVVNLSFAVNYALGGSNVVGYHVGNIALHLACALLLFGILRRTLDEEAVAFACALLWMIHPLQTEAVDYIAARTESAMALCLLATLYCAIRGWTAGAIAACAIGMACKETMAVAPLLVPLYDRAFRASSWREAWQRRKALWLGLAATWAVLVVLIASTPRAHSAGFVGSGGIAAGAWTYLLNQSALIVRYLRLILWPSGLVLDYGFPKPLSLRDVAGPVLLLAGLAAATVVAWIRRPRVGFLGLWFFVTLAPSSSVVPVLTEVGAERRMYLPAMAAIVLVVAAASKRLAQRPRLSVAALAIVAVALGAATIARNREFQSPLTLWETNVARWPHGRARVNLAAALQAAGRRDEMLEQLQAAVSDYPEARYDLGAQLATRGDVERGLRELETFAREFPSHPNARPARTLMASARTRLAATSTDEAIAAAAAGRLTEAIPKFRRAVELLPDNANVHRNLANALLDAHDYDAAAGEARAALALSPDDAAAREILGRIDRQRLKP